MLVTKTLFVYVNHVVTVLSGGLSEVILYLVTPKFEHCTFWVCVDQRNHSPIVALQMTDSQGGGRSTPILYRQSESIEAPFC